MICLRTRSKRSTGRAGFTLIELVIVSAIVSVVGVGLVKGLGLANKTHSAVASQTSSNREIRKASSTIRHELKSTSEDFLTVAMDGEGNHIVSFQLPIDGPDTVNWGAFDWSFGDTPDDRNQVGWTTRYLVVAPAQNERALVRQVLDTSDNVQLQETLVEGLVFDVDDLVPSFTLQRAGVMWEVTINTKKEESNGTRTDTFHVQLRN